MADNQNIEYKYYDIRKFNWNKFNDFYEKKYDTISENELNLIKMMNSCIDLINSIFYQEEHFFDEPQNYTYICYLCDYINIALIDNKVIALSFIKTSVYDYNYGMNLPMLTLICVDKNYRKHGIGNKILKDSINLFKNNHPNIYELYLYCNINSIEEKWYQKNGFKIINVWKNEYTYFTDNGIEYRDANAMKLDLYQ